MRPAPRPSQQPAQRGVALLLAMVMLALVVTVTAGMVWQQTRAVHVEAAERAGAQANWILNGALDWARLILREDQRSGRGQNTYDGLDEPWATPLEEARLSTFLAADQNNNTETDVEAFVSGSITDAQSRYNLRNLSDDAGKVVPAQLAGLRQLCLAAGLPEGVADQLAEAISSLPLPSGAGSPAPGAAGSPVPGVAGSPAPAPATPASGPLPTPAPQSGPVATALRPRRLGDLAWLGIEEGVLRQLAPWVDLLPHRTAVNANTAPREALVAAIEGLDLGAAQRLVQARQRQPFTKLDDLRAQLPPTLKLDEGRVGVSTAYFIVSGRLRLDDRVLEERSLLIRREGRVDVLRRERLSFALAPR
jgi:general secretion pathway protein K